MNCAHRITTPFPPAATLQDGPGSGANVITSIAALDDNSVILAGITQGDWDGELIGGEDFAVVKLSSLGVEEWRWQVRPKGEG